MNKEELGKLYPVKVVPYDPNWVSFFKNEKDTLLTILGPALALRIEHIGSTAVPGLSAKPTIDILVEIPNKAGIRDAIMNRMTRNHYIHMKEQKQHLMFVKGYTPTGLEEISFHVHMGPEDQDFLWDRIYFRDFLRMHPSVAGEYERLKLKLAQTFRNDREAYTEHKTEFVSKITKRAKEMLS
ncbi:MAG: GrpB family protein [Bacillaceae bacterium]|nr:GrpB family protein [Bacillaceae bacterium]